MIGFDPLIKGTSSYPIYPLLSNILFLFPTPFIHFLLLRTREYIDSMLGDMDAAERVGIEVTQIIKALSHRNSFSRVMPSTDLNGDLKEVRNAWL